MAHSARRSWVIITSKCLGAAEVVWLCRVQSKALADPEAARSRSEWHPHIIIDMT